MASATVVFMGGVLESLLDNAGMPKNTSNHSHLSSQGDGTDAVPRRQARGALRMESLLDAASVVMARDGYALATTNAIASQAQVSPGTLYQFFRNKAQIAEALAQRLVAQLADVQASIVPLDMAAQPLSAVIDTLVARFMAFHRANPAFEALLLGADTSPELAASMEKLYEDLIGRLQALVRERAPATLSDERVRLVAVACISIFKGLLPAVLKAPPPLAHSMSEELKLVLQAYLGTVFTDR